MSSEDLYFAVRRCHWNTARKLLGTSNAREMVEYTSPVPPYGNALHEACFRDVPSDIVQLMINTSATTPLQQDWVGYTPLHWAIKFSSEDEETIIELIEACPRAASITDNNGQTPLHWAIIKNKSSNVIHCLLAANPTTAAATNDDGETPLHLLFRTWHAPLRNSLESKDGDENIQDIILRNKFGEEMRIGNLHQTFLLFLQAATHDSIDEVHESPFRPLYYAINDSRCPWSFFNLILRMDPKAASQWDQEENLPIHVAAAATSSLDGELFMCDECKMKNSLLYLNKEDCWIVCHKCFREKGYEVYRANFKLMNSVDKIPAVIGNLLAMNPKLVKIPDGEGRLPLHIAIRSEKPLEKGLETILRTAPEGVNTRDIKTHLYPFMLSAVEHERNANELQKFTSCFTLLMNNPHLVSSGIPH